MAQTDFLPTVRLEDLIASINNQHRDPLGQLTDATILAGRLEDVSDHLVGHFVDAARRSGASWTDIDTSLGVTKQAVRKRFLRKKLDLNVDFGQFTPRARNVLAAARHHARSNHTNQIDTTDIRLGLIGESDSVAAKAIVASSVSLVSVRDLSTATLRAPTKDTATGDAEPSLDARKIFELADREGLRPGHNYIGTEHILLAVLENENGTGPLADLGLTVTPIRAEIIATLSGTRSLRGTR